MGEASTIQGKSKKSYVLESLCESVLRLLKQKTTDMVASTDISFLTVLATRSPDQGASRLIFWGGFFLAC